MDRRREKMVLEINKIFKLVITVSLIMFSFLSFLYSDIAIMPREVIRIISSLNCVPYEKFYDVYDTIIDPPFIYGVCGGERENSVAFWCKKKDKDIFILFIAIRKDSKWETEKILETTNIPGGLSLSFVKDYSLDGFYMIATHKYQKGKFTGIMLRNEIEGTYDLFVKYKGKWLIERID
jgi:hypothetical protein